MLTNKDSQCKIPWPCILALNVKLISSALLYSCSEWCARRQENIKYISHKNNSCQLSNQSNQRDYIQEKWNCCGERFKIRFTQLLLIVQQIYAKTDHLFNCDKNLLFCNLINCTSRKKETNLCSSVGTRFLFRYFVAGIKFRVLVLHNCLSCWKKRDIYLT